MLSLRYALSAMPLLVVHAQPNSISIPSLWVEGIDEDRMGFYARLRTCPRTSIVTR